MCVARPLAQDIMPGRPVRPQLARPVWSEEGMFKHMTREDYTPLFCLEIKLDGEQRARRGHGAHAAAALHMTALARRGARPR